MRAIVTVVEEGQCPTALHSSKTLIGIVARTAVPREGPGREGHWAYAEGCSLSSLKACKESIQAEKQLDHIYIHV